MNSLVGYSGFVGSNIALGIKFDNYYNSKNIKDAFGTNPDLLVYSGVPAQKFIANKFPEKDMEIIKEAMENIKKINPKKLVLISTIDVYNDPNNVDETAIINPDENQPYGKNRFFLEKWVMDNINDYLIVRLPGLYGQNIKKNFIYDLIHQIPGVLNEKKFNELLGKDNLIKFYYEKKDDGFYYLKRINKSEEKILKEYFNNVNFSALNFSDSRGFFQFYNLKYLWSHIEEALKNNIKVLNLATEPVSVSEIYNFVIGGDFINEVSNVIPNYNYKTSHYKVFNGSNGYLFNKEFILNDIKEFIDNEKGYKLSISNIAWSEDNDLDMYEYISKMGFKGLEIAPTRIIKDNPYNHLKEIKEFSDNLKRDYNLTISSMQSIWFGKDQNIFASINDREELINYTKKAIDFAETIGCNNIVFGCPKNRNIPDNMDIAEAKKTALQFFRIIGEYAQSKNTIFSIEPNPVIYNTNFLNTTQEVLEIVKELNMNSIRVNLDLGTIIENKEDINIIDNNIQYINHIHISEPYLDIIKNRKIYEDLAIILKNNNYSNFVSIEMKNQNNIDEVKKCILYIRGIF